MESLLDLTKGYWQTHLGELAKRKSVFSMDLGLYEFKVLF